MFTSATVKVLPTAKVRTSGVVQTVVPLIVPLVVLEKVDVDCAPAGTATAVRTVNINRRTKWAAILRQLPETIPLIMLLAYANMVKGRFRSW